MKEKTFILWVALKKDLGSMQTYDYKEIAQAPSRSYLPVKGLIIDFLKALDKSKTYLILKEYSILKYGDYGDSYHSYSGLTGGDFNTLILQFFANYSLRPTLIAEDFLHQLHVWITYRGSNYQFPQNHPYHQPLENIIPLKVFHKFDLNAILETVYTYIKTDQPHWYILRDLQQHLLEKKFSHTTCVTPKTIQNHVQTWENRGAKIVLSPKYAQRRAEAIRKNQCPYFTGVDRVDWGDGSRLRSMRYNLQQEAFAIRQQIFALIERIPDPYNYHKKEFLSISASEHLKTIKDLSKKYENLLGRSGYGPDKLHTAFLLTLQPEELGKWVELCEARVEDEKPLQKQVEEANNKLYEYRRASERALLAFKANHTPRL